MSPRPDSVRAPCCAGQHHAIRARADHVARPGDAQPRRGGLEHPGAGSWRDDDGNVEGVLGGFGSAELAGGVFGAYRYARLRRAGTPRPPARPSARPSARRRCPRARAPLPRPRGRAESDA